MLKQSVPWPIKFGIKLLVGATRIDYRFLKRVHLVEHGRMEDLEFSRNVFNRHVTTPLSRLQKSAAGTLLELGPGDSVATGLLGRAAGFSRVALIDTGSYADLRPAAINRLNTALATNAPVLPEDASPEVVSAQLDRQGIQYGTRGSESVRKLPPGSVGHSFSNTVLQHVYRAELPELIGLLARAHASGSLCSHLIKFTDHFSGGFLNHRFPEWFMESSLIKRAHLYTNRVSAPEFLELFEKAGFELCTVAVDFYDPGDTNHVECGTSAEFQAAIRSRQVLRAVFVLRKK